LNYMYWYHTCPCLTLSTCLSDPVLTRLAHDERLWLISLKTLAGMGLSQDRPSHLMVKKKKESLVAMIWHARRKHFLGWSTCMLGLVRGEVDLTPTSGSVIVFGAEVGRLSRARW